MEESTGDWMQQREDERTRVQGFERETREKVRIPST